MSNHLRELIDSVADNTNEFFEHMSQQQMDHVADMALKFGEQAISFYAGELDDLTEFKVIEDLVRLPYDVCWIEISEMLPDGEQFIRGNLLWTVEGIINGQAWYRNKGKWRYLWAWQRPAPGKSLVGHAPPHIPPNIIQTGICFVNLFLTAMNCVNVSRAFHSVPEKLQKARAKRGKKPLFSYWTLEVDIPRGQGAEASSVGTHESPRLHLRRGHIKRRKTGYFWWQPCVVGTKKNGMVMKDYAAKYQPRKASNASSSGLPTLP